MKAADKYKLRSIEIIEDAVPLEIRILRLDYSVICSSMEDPPNGAWSIIHAPSAGIAASVK